MWRSSLRNVLYLTARRQLPDVGGEALDGRVLVPLGVEALLDGAAQTLLHHEAEIEL